MYLRCRTVLHSELSDNPLKLPYLGSRLGLGKDGRYSQIEKGCYYVAFGVFVHNTVPHVLIRGHKHPKEDFFHRPMACFDVLDSRMSRFWHFEIKLYYDKRQETYRPIQDMAIKDWFEASSEPPISFWERVFELEEPELGIMNRMADLMEIEYAQSHVKRFGRALQNGLLECPSCGIQVELVSEFEMMRCSQCNSIFHMELDS